MTDVVRRMRPWLGTFVEIRVEGLAKTDTVCVIDAAFAEIAAVHGLMSFHAIDSDLARLHRARAGTSVRVDARTREVLECALRIAAASGGIFDPTIAAQQVAWGLLPRPDSPSALDPHANWRDIELVEDDAVRLRRPLWLDLGGIAKGYAVDRVIDILRACGATQACVNAGGDLRIFGAHAEPVFVRMANTRLRSPLVELANAAIASSARVSHDDDARMRGSHVHGVTRAAVDGAMQVSVIADRCVIADALTKIVLAGDAAVTRQVLVTFGAKACVHDPASGWNLVDCAA